MALRTKEIDLEAERGRIEEQMVELAEQQVQVRDDPGQAEALLEQGKLLQQRRDVLARVQEMWGVDSVTLAELSEGERTRVKHFVDDHEGITERVPFVAVGTHDAPYLEHDPEGITAEDFEATVQTLVDDVPIPFIDWAEAKIGDMSGLDESKGNSYFELVQAKLNESAPASGATTAEQSPSPPATRQLE